MKIQVYLRDAGIASRRGAEKLIQSRKVTVDGELATIGMRVEGTEVIKVEGMAVTAQSSEVDKTFVILNKPVEYTSTRKDPFAEKVVYDLLPKKYNTLNIVGRLDKNSEGLLLLTDDGDAVYKTTHPKYEIEKEYLITVRQNINENIGSLLEKGISDGKGIVYKAREVELIDKNTLRMVLTEGKKREIRHMLGLLDYSIIQLKRIRLGSIMLGHLKTGEYRELSKSEVSDLLSILEK